MSKIIHLKSLFDNILHILMFFAKSKTILTDQYMDVVLEVDLCNILIVLEQFCNLLWTPNEFSLKIYISP